MCGILHCLLIVMIVSMITLMGCQFAEDPPPGGGFSGVETGGPPLPTDTRMPTPTVLPIPTPFPPREYFVPDPTLTFLTQLYTTGEDRYPYLRHAPREAFFFYLNGELTEGVKEKAYWAEYFRGENMRVDITLRDSEHISELMAFIRGSGGSVLPGSPYKGSMVCLTGNPCITVHAWVP